MFVLRVAFLYPENHHVLIATNLDCLSFYVVGENYSWALVNSSNILIHCTEHIIPHISNSHIKPAIHDIHLIRHFEISSEWTKLQKSLNYSSLSIDDSRVIRLNIFWTIFWWTKIIFRWNMKMVDFWVLGNEDVDM